MILEVKLTSKPLTNVWVIYPEGTEDLPNRLIHGIDSHLNDGAQRKHILGMINFTVANAKSASFGTGLKSIFQGSLRDAQQLINQYGGTGDYKGARGEDVNCERFIGYWFSVQDSCYYPTTYGTIHYSKKSGTHIVPAKPSQFRNE